MKHNIIITGKRTAQEELDRIEAHLKTIPPDCDVAAIYQQTRDRLREIIADKCSGCGGDFKDGSTILPGADGKVYCSLICKSMDERTADESSH